ncbi:MAG: 2-phospho-L-lactate transferase [Candidatus Thorarchaeota archaeon]
MSVVALAGGVGAARFLEGLVQAMPPEQCTIIVNTGDDMANFMGLYISPDVDIITYTLAGIVDPDKGWGIKGDTFQALEVLQQLGFDTWFALGDQDLGTHLARTAMLQQGWSLSKATQMISESLGVRSRILPMTEQWVPTRIVTDVGLVHFEEYLVKRKAQDAVEDVIFDGIDGASPSPGVLEALEEAEIIIVCPSNPIVSIGPILAVPGIKQAIMKVDAPCVGVSPIIGGRPVKGPADKLMEGKGIEVSAVGVAGLYQEFLDALVIDKTDRTLAPRIEELDMSVVVEQTLMTSLARKKKLAQTVLKAAEEQKEKS